jgi:3-methyl-2-oxobutanoate hydroxymethyltransferase
MGGFRVQGREEQQRQKLMADAMAVEEAGAFAVVLECIPSDLAADITQSITIPTIGIGAGRDCDGQVLVINDVLGLCGPFRPKFVKQYAQLEDNIKKAVGEYISEVREGQFPGNEHLMK